MNLHGPSGHKALNLARLPIPPPARGEESVAAARLVSDRETKGESVYEQPSLHMELARLKHRDFEVEANRARLAAQAERHPSETLSLIRGAVSSLRDALSRRPAAARAPRLQPAG